jgi:hypothetical protein
VGVKGTSADPSGTGVAAELSSIEVPGVALTSGSLVLAMLQVNVPGLWVRAVVPHVSGQSFTIWLSETPTQDAWVAWFVVN